MARNAAATDFDGAPVQLGARIRHARLTNGLSLRELAARAGCTEGFLSKIENNKSLPSLATLHRLAAALGMNTASLFEPAREDIGPVYIVRRGARPTISTSPERTGAGITLERLVSSATSRLLQANIHVVEPGSSTDGTIRHVGEEVGFVLEGSISLNVCGTNHIVNEGDAFFFESNLPHGYTNPGKVTARIIWINTPPSF